MYLTNDEDKKLWREAEDMVIAASERWDIVIEHYKRLRARYVQKKKYAPHRN